MSGGFTLCFGTRSWDPTQLEQEVQAWAERLAGSGVAERGTVAVCSHNRPELVFAILAALRLGARLALLNARLTPAELSPQVQRLRPCSEISLEKTTPRSPRAKSRGASSSADGLIRADSCGDGPGAAPRLRACGPTLGVNGGHGHGRPSTPLGEVVLFTSGTTGTPKAACLTVEQLLGSAAASQRRLGTDQTDRWLCSLPLFHVGGLAMLFRAAHDGSTLVLHDRFDPRAVATALREGGITRLSLVSTTLRALLDEGAAGPALESVLVGGGPVPLSLLDRARARGWPVLQTYGLTEACSQVCTEEPGRADGRTCGPPLPGTELRVLREDGSPAARHEVGEVQIRGPTVMSGYLDDPSGFDGDWLRTGDLGSLDGERRLTVCARRTDLILTGGENVYPAEIEAVLLAHEGVREAAVLPCEDARWGQVPVAAVVADPGVDAGTLEAHCRASLAGFKVPRRYVELPALPRTAAGKVDRLALRALLAPVH